MIDIYDTTPEAAFIWSDWDVVGLLPLMPSVLSSLELWDDEHCRRASGKTAALRTRLAAGLSATCTVATLVVAPREYLTSEIILMGGVVDLSICLSVDGRRLARDDAALPYSNPQDGSRN